ncbi:BCCT family transporter [Stenoxybacter acetivorans]|uniref:BCCT family transporter n=1 Tax=Stenoxybacter acetivorans TaxID=422441 RepID=UPI00068F77E2|nr:BCCT family transporter [Stenoxybacter acetivorans]
MTSPTPSVQSASADSSRSGRINPAVFYSSSIIVAIILLYAIIAPDQAASTFKIIQAAIVANASWYYVLTVALIVVASFYLVLSRFGDIRLGPDHIKPDYGNLSWFSMLFSAGVGIGLMFFGVAEPVMHFLSPPLGEGGSIAAAKEAMRLTFFHWGIHGWAIYAIVALILAFFSYRHHLPLSLSSALFPLIGNKIYGPIGNAVDVFAVIGTLFGIATSLGLGVVQINTGIHYLFNGIPVTVSIQIILIVIITALATFSAVSGLNKGVKLLSEINMGMAAILMLFVLFAGPTVFLLQALVQNIGSYITHFSRMTFNLYIYQPTDWFGGWTVFYWGWWLSWAPFVGMFIAKISRGRTIREFIVGVLLIPTGFIFLWMTVFGNSAIDMILNQGMSAFGETVSNNVPIALFSFLENLPHSTLFIYLSLFMIVIFFVTSADSSALVMDMLCSYGESSKGICYRIYWSCSSGVIAIVLLLAGGLTSLQTMAIASALPFVTVLMFAIYGLFKALNIDSQKQILQQISSVSPSTAINGDWRERLHVLIDCPNKDAVTRFIQTTVHQALTEVASELNTANISAKISQPGKGVVQLTTNHGDEIDFVYRVVVTEHLSPAFVNTPDNTNNAYYRAEVHLVEGGQDYDIMGWSKNGIIDDVIDQYHKHLHFLQSLR